MIRIKNHLKFAAKSGEYNEFHSFTKTPKFGQPAEKTYPTVFAVLVSHNARGKLEKNTSDMFPFWLSVEMRFNIKILSFHFDIRLLNATIMKCGLALAVLMLSLCLCESNISQWKTEISSVDSYKDKLHWDCWVLALSLISRDDCLSYAARGSQLTLWKY